MPDPDTPTVANTRTARIIASAASELEKMTHDFQGESDATRAVVYMAQSVLFEAMNHAAHGGQSPTMQLALDIYMRRRSPSQEDEIQAGMI